LLRIRRARRFKMLRAKKTFASPAARHWFVFLPYYLIRVDPSMSHNCG
jgi:hypothetical protein